MNTTTARTGLAGRGGLGDEGGRTSSDEEEEDAVGYGTDDKEGDDYEGEGTYDKAEEGEKQRDEEGRCASQ